MPPRKSSSPSSGTSRKSSAASKRASGTSAKPSAKPASSSAPSRGARRSAASSRSTEGLREQLQRFLNPLGAMVVTRDRLQEALDDAVERGRMTRDDASELLAELVRRGRKQTDDLLSDLEGVLDGTRRAAAAPTGRMLREVERARRAAGLGPAFPIAGYDDLTAAQVTERLRDLSPPELRRVRDYERRNANRKSVLAAVEQRLK